MKKVIIKVVVGILILIIIFVVYAFTVIMRLSKVSAGEPIPEYANAQPALLVIDIQEGTTGKLSITPGYVRQAEPFIQKVNEVIRMADSLKMPIVYIYHENTHWLANLISNNVMAKDAPGAAIDSRIQVISENIFNKNYMDAFTNPDLDAFLRTHQVNTLYVTGLDAAYCVDRTTQAALKRGYKVTVIQDALISETEKKKEEMLKKYNDRGIIIVNAANWWE